MQKIIEGRLANRFSAYSELADLLDADLLSQKIDVPKHKSLAEHLWCIVGARESYAKAIEQGSWLGFSCSLQTFDVEAFRAKLAESAVSVQAAIRNVDDWDEERLSLLATLAEHEVMHEGQIIRHMYALQRELPDSWVWS